VAVIGIITCEILEREFAGLLADDPAIGRISVLENRHSARLIALLGERARCELQCLPHMHAYRPEPAERIEVLVRVLALGLHRKRKVLRDALRGAADELAPHVSTLLLGYGLCGNALDDPRSLLDVDVPLVLPTDQDHPVDDCVALSLGGRDAYFSELRACPGTYFLTPGWSTHWPRMFDTGNGELAQAGRQRVLAGYQRALLVLTPALADAPMRRLGRAFCAVTGLRLEERRGSLTLLAEAWARAKRAAWPAATSALQGGDDASDRVD
jgi:hypothetical protein